MSLKHLLNDKDIIETHRDGSHLGWHADGDLSEQIPPLPDQIWDVNPGVLQSLQYDWMQSVDSNDAGDESFQLAQGQIEDWTAGRVDQDLEVEAPLNEELICYGTVQRSQVKLCGDMAQLDYRLSRSTKGHVQGHTQMKLVKNELKYYIAFPDGTILGEINAQLEKVLLEIAENLDFEVFVPTRMTREKIGTAKKEKDALVRVHINVYGPRGIAQRIGKEFSQQKIYLQRPEYVRDGTVYDNPHYLKIASFETATPDPVAYVEERRSKNVTEETLDAITKVYSSLTRGKNLKGLEGDEQWKTPLLQHQKKALDFMMQREEGPIPEDYILWKPAEIEGAPCYRHAVTNTISRLKQTETGGGILADEMGMGKSLSILALIVRTLNAAHQWTTENDATAWESIDEGCKLRKRSKGTLIVASSDLMINEWFQELDKHFDEPTLRSISTNKYHGQNRKSCTEEPCNFDIVITTYHTLASEFNNANSPLRHIEWWRLVLDEAHMIRRQSTSLYRTVADISARSRWCLTGTPIQNRLEDIGSLFAFLRVNPFHSLSVFRKFISIPFDDGGKRRQLAVQRFTLLLDSFCLRQTKDLLNLPDQQSRIRKVILSPEERNQYNKTKIDMFRASRNQHGTFDGKSTLGMFQVQTQLRIICNHGTWQHQFSWNRRKLHLIDEREAMEESSGGQGEVKCSACRQTMPLFNTGAISRRYEDCQHVMCSECLQQNVPNDQESLPTNCQLCSALWAPSSQEDTYFRAEGRSSKMEALIKDVSTDMSTTKSIIFTSWTRTLDLLQRYLFKANLGTRHFKRIDGDCPTSKRERIIHEFTEDPQMRILIMTTGTGAVGLNLAAANRVFIVEPQWNPSVENQAIARALRLGQKQSVLVTRYVVDQTVELDMLKLQDRKLERANLVKNG